jgi:hypothetical protein
MTPNEQFVKTLEKLLERTKKNEVNWQRAGENTFKVLFQFAPDTSIFVASLSPKAAPDFCTAMLFAGDKIAISIDAEDGTDTDMFNLLHELWTQAERSVVKWDQSLDVVNKALDSEQVVGLATVPDDDVPFKLYRKKRSNTAHAVTSLES